MPPTRRLVWRYCVTEEATRQREGFLRSRTCCSCGCPSRLCSFVLCDYPMPPRKSGTCDAWVCTDCATHREPDRDYCPQHARLVP
jgi:hypothetical protein